MQGLMTHCGARQVSRPELEAMPFPEVLGPRHHPVKYASFAGITHRALEANGFEIRSEAHAVMGKDDGLYFGYFEVATSSSEDDFSLAVGLRGSTTQQIREQVVIGERVFVCDNWAFSGEIYLAHKNTRSALQYLMNGIYDSVRNLRQVEAVKRQQLNAYRDVQIEDGFASKTLLQLADDGALNYKSTLKRAWDEWQRPTYSEHAEGGKTLWRLFNACTEASKGTSARTIVDRTKLIHGKCTEIAQTAGAL